jgi:hypothetical protein
MSGTISSTAAQKEANRKKEFRVCGAAATAGLVELLAEKIAR